MERVKHRFDELRDLARADSSAPALILVLGLTLTRSLIKADKPSTTPYVHNDLERLFIVHIGLSMLKRALK